MVLFYKSARWIIFFYITCSVLLNTRRTIHVVHCKKHFIVNFVHFFWNSSDCMFTWSSVVFFPFQLQLCIYGIYHYTMIYADLFEVVYIFCSHLNCRKQSVGCASMFFFLKKLFRMIFLTEMCHMIVFIWIPVDEFF